MSETLVSRPGGTMFLLKPGTSFPTAVIPIGASRRCRPMADDSRSAAEKVRLGFGMQACRLKRAASLVAITEKVRVDAE